MIKCAIKINKKIIIIKLYNYVIIKIKSLKIFVEAKFKVRLNVILRLGQTFWNSQI